MVTARYQAPYQPQLVLQCLTLNPTPSASLPFDILCSVCPQVIRNYHGHLSGVYCLALHPTLDLIMTGGRDSTCRVWDMRTKLQVHALSGHTNTVASVLTQPTDPQVITGSHDTTIRLWDLRKGTTSATLTYHKKSVRALVAHPSEHTFASAGADNIKKFRLPNVSRRGWLRGWLGSCKGRAGCAVCVPSYSCRRACPQQLPRVCYLLAGCRGTCGGPRMSAWVLVCGLAGVGDKGWGGGGRGCHMACGD